jgi:hypothetical protein
MALGSLLALRSSHENCQVNVSLIIVSWNVNLKVDQEDRGMSILSPMDIEPPRGVPV